MKNQLNIRPFCVLTAWGLGWPWTFIMCIVKFFLYINCSLHVAHWKKWQQGMRVKQFNQKLAQSSMLVGNEEYLVGHFSCVGHNMRPQLILGVKHGGARWAGVCLQAQQHKHWRLLKTASCEACFISLTHLNSCTVSVLVDEKILLSEVPLSTFKATKWLLPCMPPAEDTHQWLLSSQQCRGGTRREKLCTCYGLWGSICSWRTCGR